MAAVDSSDTDGSDDSEEQVRLWSRHSTTPAAIQQHLSRNKRLYQGVFLALRVGLWVALVAALSIQKDIRMALFGHGAVHYDTATDPENSVAYQLREGAVVTNATMKMCTSSTVGTVAYYVPDPDVMSQPVITQDVSALPPGTAVTSIWCGLIPDCYVAALPSVVQMILFTVYGNTGCTIQLAWQGVAGTLCATLNIWVMNLIYPYGRAECVCGSCKANHEHCEEGAVLQESPNYSEVVAILDTLGLLLLFLLSTASENTIKFGMSWHIYYMMNFMNPAKGTNMGEAGTPLGWDSELTVTMLTAVSGALLAVLLTLIPHRIASIFEVNRDAKVMISATSEAWGQAIGYVRGTRKTARSWQIKQRIDDLSGIMSSVKGNLASAWWETFDIGKFGRVRHAYMAFQGMTEGTADPMKALSTAVLNEGFTHVRFMAAVGEPIEKLHSNAKHLMHLCADVMEDGTVDQAEAENLEDAIASVENSQRELSQAYKLAKPVDEVELSNQVMFMFLLSYWARKYKEFARDIKAVLPSGSAPVSKWCSAPFDNLLSLYKPSSVCDPEHLNFAFRNWFVISLVYVISRYMVGHVRSQANVGHTFLLPYDSAPASTLALLVSHYPGAAIQKNLKRVLGIALSKAFPLLCGLVLHRFQCLSLPRFFAQEVLIVLLTWMLMFIYMSDSSYSYVAMLVVGFAVPQLLEICQQSSDDNTLANSFKSFEGVICALVVQMLLDMLLIRQRPRHEAMSVLADAVKTLQHGFTSIWQEDLSEVLAASASAASLLEHAAQVGPETDFQKVVLPRHARPFQSSVYLKAVHELSMLQSTLSMIGVLATQHEKLPHSPGLLQLLARQKASAAVRSDLLDTMSTTLEALELVLSHRDENSFQEATLEHLMEQSYSHLAVLDGADSLARELLSTASMTEGDPGNLSADLGVNLLVTVEFLKQARYHIGNLSGVILQSNIY